MRVLQIAPPWFPVPPIAYGGTELVVSALVDGLVERGHAVLLVATGGSRTRAELCSPYAAAPSRQLGDALTELSHVVAGYDRRAGFELVHDHSPVGAAIGALASEVPVVHTVHGDWTPALRRLYGLIGERIALVAISRAHAARAGDLPISAVIPNGIPLERYRFSDCDAGWLAFLGRAGADKGALVALDVAERLGRPLRMAVKVNEAEEHRWWREEFTPRLRDATVEVDVTTEVTHDGKVALLGGAVAVLVPIQWEEPFGLVMAEANACGTPVVAFARGAAPEVVADGVSGVLVPPGDVDGFCAATERACRLERRACRQHVETHFSAQRMVDDYLRLYRRLRTFGAGLGPVVGAASPPPAQV